MCKHTGVNIKTSNFGKTRNGLKIYSGYGTVNLIAHQASIVDLRPAILQAYDISEIDATHVTLRTNLPNLITCSSDCGVFYFFNDTDMSFNNVRFEHITIGK